MTEMFEGVSVTLGRQTYIVPALTIGQIKRMGEALAVMKSLDGRAPAGDEMDKMFALIHAALSRNYPDITPEQLLEIVDMNNLDTVIKAITGQSGLERTRAGEA